MIEVERKIITFNIQQEGKSVDREAQEDEKTLSSRGNESNC